MKTPTQIERLLRNGPFQTRDFQQDELLYNEGEPMQGVHFLLSGTVKITRLGKNGHTLVWIGDPGEFVGLSSFFRKNGRYAFNALAIRQNCESIFIPNAEFEDIVARNDEFKQMIISELCYRIDFMESRTSNILNAKSRQKLLDLLILLTDKVKKKNPKLQGNEIVVAYSPQDIAELSGISSRHLRKLFKEFQNQNLILPTASGIQILDTKELLKARNMAILR